MSQVNSHPDVQRDVVQRDVGSLLYQFRKRADLTQQELAYRAYFGRSTISDYENGQMIPNRDNLLRLIHVLCKARGIRTRAEADDLLTAAQCSPLNDEELFEIFFVKCESRRPYLGLPAYNKENHDVFFGRNQEVSALCRQLAEHHLALLVGPSGSGKSSILKAGLLHSLDMGVLPGSEQWEAIDFHPDTGTGDVFTALCNGLKNSSCFCAILNNHLELNADNVEQVADVLRQDRKGQLLRKWCETLVEHTPCTSVLLAIDQFEEVFRYDPGVCSQFFQQITSAWQSPVVRIALTLRADFLMHCYRYGDLIDILNHSTHLPHIPRPDLLVDMMTGPARIFGYSVEDRLVTQLLSDLNGGLGRGTLPLISFVFDTLWQHRVTLKKANIDQPFSVEAYEYLGKIHKMLLRLTHNLPGLSSANELALKRVFVRLVRLDGESQVPVSRRVKLSEFADHPELLQIVQYLASPKVRLLTVDAESSGEPVVELAHEVLIDVWASLSNWVNAIRVPMQEVYDVKRATILWQNAREKAASTPASQQDPAIYLWPQGRIDQFEDLLKDHAELCDLLTEQDHHFLRPEYLRLMEELNDPQTTHHRRFTVGKRLNVLGDCDLRPGIGLACKSNSSIRQSQSRIIRREISSDGRRFWAGGLLDNKLTENLPDIIWCEIPACSIAIDDQQFYVPSCYISKYPITCEQWQSFVRAPDGYYHPAWWQIPGHGQAQRKGYFSDGNMPKTHVSWYQALAFCLWLSSRLEKHLDLDNPLHLHRKSDIASCKWIRLPTEWEWQAAMTYGEAFAPGEISHDLPSLPHANVETSAIYQTTAVGMYPHAKAACGALDMIGNVWEWCLNDSSFDTALTSKKRRSVRGGSYRVHPVNARSAYRHALPGTLQADDVGFRLLYRFHSGE
nr:SUMF1/EgtB/PvdO family nonheme iron enzyme [Anaerolineae bacterium]